MKILFAHDRLGAHGGAETNLRHTARELKIRGHTLGLLHGPGTGRGEGDWREIFFERFPLSAGSADIATEVALDTFQPDIVYAHSLSDSPVLAALARAGVPRVRMVHDHQPFCLRGCKYPPWTRRPCARALSPFCVFPCGASVARDRSGGWPFQWVSYSERKSALALTRGFHRVIVASGYMRDELLRNGFDPARIEIHAPVPPLSTDDMDATASARVPHRIIFAGQLVRGKGVDVLLESLALVHARFECIVAGDGHHREHCEALSGQLGLDDRVKFLGYVPPEQLDPHYRESAIAVVSSVWPEPFGLAGLEAMRHGLPIVAFDTGGIREWLRDGESGFVAPWMDRVAFAARIELLLRDPEIARRLGEHGRALATTRFDFSRYISGLETLFARVAAEHRCKVAA